MTHNGIWDEVIRTIRDPIFGLVFAVFLAFLSSRPIRRFIRFACLLAAVIILIWLAAHNTSSAHVEIAVVAAVTRVLLTFIAVLFVVCLIAMVALSIMYFKAGPASSLSSRRSAWRTRPSFIEHGLPSVATSGLQGSSSGDAADGDIAMQTLFEEGIQLGSSFERVILLLDDLFDNLDYCNNPAQVCVELMRIYFSGLSAHSAEIREAHEECNKSVERMASALGRVVHNARLPLRDMSGKNWFPSSSEWAAVAQDGDFYLPYLALRIICLKTAWRAVIMVIYKSYACWTLLTQLDDL